MFAMRRAKMLDENKIEENMVICSRFSSDCGICNAEQSI